jgi:hypothetical protein
MLKEICLFLCFFLCVSQQGELKNTSTNSFEKFRVNTYTQKGKKGVFIGFLAVFSA